MFLPPINTFWSSLQNQFRDDPPIDSFTAEDPEIRLAPYFDAWNGWSEEETL